MMHKSASAATSKVVLRSLYRSLLRASTPFSQPAYASLIHRTGIAHDWEECIHRLDMKRRTAAADVSKSYAVASSSSDDDDVNNDGDKKKHDNAPEKSIPKSWAQNLSRSYPDLQQEYELRKDYFDQRFGTDDFDDDDDDDDESWETDLVMGTSSHYRHEVQYSISDDPKYILFRQLLREWFTSSSGDNLSNNNTDNGEKSTNKWPKEWSPDAEGYYENGEIKQVPLMRFPSQIVSDGGLSIREMIQREFRAPSVEDRLSMELAFAKQKEKDETYIPIVYPSSSYIDTDIRVQTAFLSLMELNRKLAWAESLGFPATSQNQKANQEERKRKRLVQAAKGVSAFPPLVDIAEQSDNMADDINIVGNDGSGEESVDKTNNKTSSSPLQCGTYLIAHPLMTGYFAKSVIVLLDHTEEVNSSLAKTEEGGSGGTYGLIINRLALQSEMVESSSREHLDLLRQKWEEKKSKLGEEPTTGSSLELATSPEPLSAGRITDNATSQDTTQSATIKGTIYNIQRPISLLQAINADDLPETVIMAFGDAHVRDGGPVNLSLQMIHRKKSEQDGTNEKEDEKQKEESTSTVGGTILGSDNDNQLESEETIYFNGDVVKASHDVLKGKSDVDDYSFIIGAACWSPGQLEHEIERGCWLPFRGPPQMAMTGMCEHNDITVPISENGDGTEIAAGGTKLSMFPPRPSNTATSSVAGSVGKTSAQQQSIQPKERPVGDLWLSVMCALGEGEGELAYMMLNNKNVSNKLGDSCDNFDR